MCTFNYHLPFIIKILVVKTLNYENHFNLKFL